MGFRFDKPADNLVHGLSLDFSADPVGFAAAHNGYLKGIHRRAFQQSSIDTRESALFADA